MDISSIAVVYNLSRIGYVHIDRWLSFSKQWLSIIENTYND